MISQIVMRCPKNLTKIGFCSLMSSRGTLKIRIALLLFVVWQSFDKNCSETAEKLGWKELGLKYNGRSLTYRGNHNNAIRITPVHQDSASYTPWIRKSTLPSFCQNFIKQWPRLKIHWKIFQKMCLRKKFENRSIFGEAVTKTRWCTFLSHSVDSWQWTRANS